MIQGIRRVMILTHHHVALLHASNQLTALQFQFTLLLFEHALLSLQLLLLLRQRTRKRILLTLVGGSLVTLREIHHVLRSHISRTGSLGKIQASTSPITSHLLIIAARVGILLKRRSHREASAR